VLDGLSCAIVYAAEGDGVTPEDSWAAGQGGPTRVVTAGSRHTRQEGGL
jgi:hypothetical protein